MEKVSEKFSTFYLPCHFLTRTGNLFVEMTSSKGDAENPAFKALFNRVSIIFKYKKMKFEKLNLEAFSNEKLTNNCLRSVKGGTKWPTCVEGEKIDIVDEDGCTHWTEGGSSCDTDGCT